MAGGEDRGEFSELVWSEFMHVRLLQLAAGILEKADRGQPADQVLRTELKAAHLTRRDAGAVSRGVFAWGWWRGWVDGSRARAMQVAEALALAERYAREPETFGDAELLERGVPVWAGGEVAVTAEWVRSLQREPVLWLRTRRGYGEQVLSILPGAVAGPWEDCVRYAGEEDLFRTPGFQAGEFELQDIASQSVGRLCDPRPGETWWDACAGEGGKTLHLSSLMEGRGLIWASDRVEWRLQRLKMRAARAGVFNYRSAEWDGGERLPTKTMFDGVLVDGPCSGVGTWGRNPHARWTVKPADVHELAAVQTRLLEHACRAVKPGGRLVYAVCTLTGAETTRVAAEFERRHPEFRPLGFRDPFRAEEAARVQLWLWPQVSGGNGMFVAGWERT